jgi:glycosyltransferase involved in cell wall biosynthesis
LAYLWRLAEIATALHVTAGPAADGGLGLRASVVIPTYNSSDLLANCLESLRHQRVPAGDAVEVLVVDDGSSDSTREVVQHHAQLNKDLRYLHTPRSAASSRSMARNSGARAACGEVLIFLDGDQIVPTDFVARHLSHHTNREKVAVIGFRKYLGSRESDVRRFCLSGDESFLGPVLSSDLRFALLDRLAYLTGELKTAWHLFFSCNVSVQARDFWEVGGGSEGFFGWGLEDSELGYKLSRSGCRFVADTENVVYHQGPPIRPAEDVYAGWQENLNVFMRIHDYPVDVVLQKLLAPFFDPDRRADWIECYERFELAVRVAHGMVDKRIRVDVG